MHSGVSCTFKQLIKNGHLDLKKFMYFCFFIAEVTKLCKAHPSTMELYVKMLLFWHKLDNYLFVYRECSYRNKHRKSGSIFLLDYLPAKFLAALIEATAKFVKMSPHTSHPENNSPAGMKSNTVVSWCLVLVLLQQIPRSHFTSKSLNLSHVYIYHRFINLLYTFKHFSSYQCQGTFRLFSLPNIYKHPFNWIQHKL